ncbi:MAG: hypothetical protein AMS27_18305 [Bacteroides sp. SM23_62_1]|nr:MAG: hypothetical protein AMS27_18305 [Bacteroides sp. SM23_62_1]
MIQRIQTLYLLFALILTVLLFFSPIIEILTDNNQLLVFKSSGLYEAESDEIIIKTVPVTILLAVVVFLYFIAILLYKRRVLQARICMLTILLLAGLAGLLIYYLTFVFRKIDTTGSSFQLAALYPVICIILTYLAYRGIRKDEQIVRSIEKIR